MLSEQFIYQTPSAVKALTGLTLEEFTLLVQQFKGKYQKLNRKRLASRKRVRNVGGGRKNEKTLTMRIFALLTYCRLHIPQRAVAAILTSIKQSDLTRDLRRLLPLFSRHDTPKKEYGLEVKVMI